MSHRPGQSGDSCREPTIQNLSTNRADYSLSRIYAAHSREYSHYLERHIP